jgi:hypothetical protein
MKLLCVSFFKLRMVIAFLLKICFRHCVPTSVASSGFLVVSAVAADSKTIYDEIVRGKVGGEYRRCQNARIQNVFGGVTSADFVANDDMQQRCSGQNSASVEDLRKDILSKIVNNVLKIPPIKAVHKVNIGD